MRILASRIIGMTAALLTLSAGAAHASDFRVNPYLTSPSTQGITIAWISFTDQPGTLTVEGPGLATPLVVTTTPTLETALDYQISDELTASNFAATAVAGGAAARNWKHSVVVTGLTPGQTYTYTVVQGGASFTRTFETAPLPADKRRIRMAVFSDSETLVAGRSIRRGWSVSPQAPGSTGRPAALPLSNRDTGQPGYLVTETLGYQENIKAIDARDPDLIVMPGDIVEGSGAEAQRRWDEFWRHNAGQYDDLLSNHPLVAVMGNNCIFMGGSASGTGLNFINTRIQLARNQFTAYFDFPANGEPAFQDTYFRQDFGPITILSLCSVKATEAANHLVGPTGTGVTGGAPTITNRDTNRAWFNQLYTFGDIPDFNVGTRQWQWAQDQIAAARAEGRIVFMQWHHTPWSRGIHGSSLTSNQSGEAMRIYTPVAEQFRVAGIFCGHSEVSERSFIDQDNDGFGVNLWDVGAAGDGLRGVEDPAPPLTTTPAIAQWTAANPGFQMNPFHQWSADQSEPELWDGNRLISGGKHYGFLEVDVMPFSDNRFRITYTPFHVFPLTAGDAAFTVTGFELRTYRDRVIMQGPPDNLRRITCPAEFDGAPGITVGDLFAYLNEYFSVAPAADVDASGEVTSGDIFAFLRDYFGC